MSASQAQVLEQLLEREFAKKPGSLLSGLGAKVSVASSLPSSADRKEPFATTIKAFDRVLGGLPRGKFVELVGARSSGRFSVGIAALAAATGAGENTALVDLGDHLDPQLAAAAGVDLERLLWVRPERLKEALAAAEMLLATGFPLVVLDLGMPPLPGGAVPDASWVRLARAANAQRAALLLLSPYRVSGFSAEAVVAAGSAGAAWQGKGATPKILVGISACLTLTKHVRVREGVQTPFSLSPWERAGVRGVLKPPRNSRPEFQNLA